MKRFLSPILLLAMISIQAWSEETHEADISVIEVKEEQSDVPVASPEPFVILEEPQIAIANTSAPDLSQAVECCVMCPVNYRPILEAKAGYFFFSDSLMREVYDKGGVDLQLSGRYPIYKWLQVYGSFEYMQRNGKSLGGEEYTSIWSIPLSLGLQGVVAIRNTVEYYVTLGPRYSYTHVHNDSDFVDRTLNKNGFGGFANTGFYFFPTDHLVVDVFAEYSYMRVKFDPDHPNVFGRSIQIGGFAFGAGLGYAF